MPFRLFAEHGRLVLEGSVDAFAADRLARLLPLAAAARPGAVLDLGRLRFVDHHGVLALQRYRGDLEVRHAPYAVARLCDLPGVELS